MLRIQKAAMMADVGSHVCKLSARCSQMTSGLSDPAVKMTRGLRTAVGQLRQKAEETTIAGIPYKNLSIGVPKELFTVCLLD